MSSGLPGSFDAEERQERGSSTDADLVELENYIHDIWKFLPVPICQISPRGVILDLDQAFEELMGYSKDELAGSLLSGYFVNSGEFEYMQSTTLAEGSVGDFLSVLRGKEKDRIVVNVSTLVRKDEGGQHIGYFAAFVDVTEREKADTALRESKEKYRDVIEHSIQGIIVVQEDPLRIQFANQALVRIFGYSLEEMVRFTPREIGALIHEEDRERVLERLRSVLAGGPTAPSYRLRIVRKDGTVAWIEIFGNRILYEGRSAVQVSVLDVTDRKKIEEELRESEEKYRNLVEQSLLGIVIAKAVPFEIFFANAAAADIFGYSPEELTSLAAEKIQQVIHPEDMSLVFRRFKTLIEGGASEKQEIRIRRRDGVERWIEIFGHRMEHMGEAVLQVTVIDITEKRQAERAQMESELRYKTLFEKSPLSITIVNTTGVVTDCNTRTEEIIGYRKEEIVGKRFNELLTLTPESIPALQEKFEKLAGGYDVEPYELEFTKKDGTKSVVQVTNATVTERETIIGFQIIAADITEQKKIETEMRASEQKYLRLSQEFKGILDAIPDNLTFQGPDMRIVWANQAAAVSISRTVDDLIGKRCFELWHGRKEPCEGCPVILAMQKKLPVIGEIKTPDSRYWEVRGFPILENGRVRGAVEIARDITGRSLMETALREGEEKYRLLLEQSGDIISYFSEEGKVLAMNRNAAQGLASDPKELVGKHLSELFDERLSALALERICRVVTSGESEEHEDIVALPTENGWFRSSYHLVRGAKGNPVGVQIISRNITERKRMEEELQRSERMKLLAQLAIGVSHEVRNPLGAILASTEALYHDLEGHSEYSEYLTHIRTQVNRLSMLMKDLLELGKPIEESTFENESLQMLCLSGVELWRQSTNFKKHRLQFIKPEGVENIIVKADGSRLQQVCINLLENAAQNSAEGTEIILKIFEPKDGIVRIQVIDEGTGIEADDLRRVFEPFFSTRKQGSGLGLSIVKQIIETHGGSVDIYNNENGPGCTAEIKLPVLS